jgi:hypothetical protein
MAKELGVGNKLPGILPKLAQFELTLTDWAEKNLGASKYVAFANKCWPAFQTQFGFVPCYVNSRLVSRLIPAACEVDIYGALSEYIISCATEMPATLLDINNTVPADLYEAEIKGKYNYTGNDVFMGPLISENFRTRFRKYCRAVTSKGHTALLEGDTHEVQGYRGNYAKPGIYKVDWQNGSPFLNDEPPGPIALLYVVKNWEEAVSLHNQANYRMTASIFTRPQNPVLPELRDALRTGSVNVNRGTIGQSLRSEHLSPFTATAPPAAPSPVVPDAVASAAPAATPAALSGRAVTPVAPLVMTERDQARLRGYEGDPCWNCGQFTLARNGTCLKCDSCGETSGCS